MFKFNRSLKTLFANSRVRMASQSLPCIDTSPPRLSHPESFDASLFHKQIPILAVRVHPSKAGLFLSSPVMKGSLLQLPKIKSVVMNQDSPTEKLVLLGTADERLLSSQVQELIERESLGLTPYIVNLNYNYWTADEIIEAVLPPGLPEGTPTSFAAAGHLAHLNLRDEYLPFKHIIGQVILDKNPHIRTVVNKLQNIHSQFRYFEMELLAGENDTLVEVSESGCKFKFDFRNVYWNSRLHHEHERLVSLFKPGEVVVDVFAGVGPFALPAAKGGCVVFANDLNPESFKWLKHNIEHNHVEDRVRPFCEDGAEFIKSVVKLAWEEPFPELGPVKSSNQRAREARQRRNQSSPLLGEGSRRISHFVMNLPDSAITFLGSFEGIFAELCQKAEFKEVYVEYPVVHCYCFTKELELEKAEKEIRQRSAQMLGHALPESTSFQFVRRVAPNKDMYCFSFRLSKEVAS